MMSRRPLLLHPAFLASLALLLLNDGYLKAYHGSWFTGKLSDVAGLIVFPVFIAWLLPRTAKWIVPATALLFVLWKSPLSTPLIGWINSHGPFPVARVVDYTDLLALPVLLLAQRLINAPAPVAPLPTILPRLLKGVVAVFSLFAICATTMIRTEMPAGTVYIGKQYTIPRSKEETIAAIRALGYDVAFHSQPSRDSAAAADSSFISYRSSYYQTDNIVIAPYYGQPADTIRNVKYTLTEIKPGKTRIEIVNVTMARPGQIQSWRTLRFLSKQYRKLLEHRIIRKLR